MDKQQIKEKINSFLVEELEIDASKIKDEALLKSEVGIDSLDFVDVVVFVSTEFGFKMQKQDMVSVRTLGDFYEYVSVNAKK